MQVRTIPSRPFGCFGWTENPVVREVTPHVVVVEAELEIVDADQA